MLALRPDVYYYTVLIQLGQTNVIHKIVHGTVEYLRQSQKRVDAIESAVHQSKVNKQAGWFDGLIQALATTWLTLTCPMIVTKCIANTSRRWWKQFHVKRDYWTQQARLLNTAEYLLVHDILRPYTKESLRKRCETKVQVDAICYPLYSLDIAFTDGYFFWSLDVFFIGKLFKYQQDVEIAFQDSTDVCIPSFYSSGIIKLPTKWQKVTEDGAP